MVLQIYLLLQGEKAYFSVSCSHHFRINLSSNHWKGKGSYLILSFKLSHESINFNDVLPSVPCLCVPVKSSKALAITDAFVFSVVFSCCSFFVYLLWFQCSRTLNLGSREQPNWTVYSFDCTTCFALYILIYISFSTKVFCQSGRKL